MRHADYGEPAPFRFLPLARAGNRNVGSWWRTRDGHFTLSAYAAGWRIVGNSVPQQRWLVDVSLVTDRAGAPVVHASIRDALLALAANLHAHEVTFPAAETVTVQFPPTPTLTVRDSSCGHWRLHKTATHGWCLTARTRHAQACVVFVHGDTLALYHPTISACAEHAARMLARGAC